MASVFPFEIYDEIIDLVGHNETLAMAKFTFLQCSLVCHAWLWKCRPLAWRALDLNRWDVPSLYAFRRFIISAPHLAELIEEIHMRQYRTSMPEQGSASIPEIFYCVIAKHLPRLANVAVETLLDPLRDRLSFHPYFAYSRLQLHTVTTLRLQHIAFSDTFEFDHLLKPFQNLRTLIMYQVFLMPLDYTRLDRWPRPMKVVPIALEDLQIAYRGTEPQAALDGPFNLVGLDQLLFSVSRTLKALSLNLPVTRALTMVPQWNDECNTLVCPELSTIHLTLDCRFDAEIRTIRAPSMAHIAEFPHFLLRLESKGLSRLILTFDLRETIPEPLRVLEELRKIREMMEVTILGRFPCLRTVSFDMGSNQDMRAWWSDRIAECFPLLYKKGMIDVMVWVWPRFAEPALQAMYPSRTRSQRFL